MRTVKSTSIDNLISKIIRDTRIPDSSYTADFHEWIPEAMALMGVGIDLVNDYYKVPIYFHVGKLPCGLQELLAIEYLGTRLQSYIGLRYPSQAAQAPEEPVFQTTVTTTDMPSGPVLDLNVVAKLPINTSEGYKTQLDSILTTFADGVVTIYYKHALNDERGLPLIPDHADYREAIYWHVVTKLIQSGYEHPVYGHDDRLPVERFEKHAARAIADLTYASIDEKEMELTNLNFVPPADYYDSFFNVVNPEPAYGYNVPQSSFIKANTATLNNGSTGVGN